MLWWRTPTKLTWSSQRALNGPALGRAAAASQAAKHRVKTAPITPKSAPIKVPTSVVIGGCRQHNTPTMGREIAYPILEVATALGAYPPIGQEWDDWVGAVVDTIAHIEVTTRSAIVSSSNYKTWPTVRFLRLGFDASSAAFP